MNKRARITKQQARGKQPAAGPGLQIGNDLAGIGKLFSVVGGIVKFAVGFAKAVKEVNDAAYGSGKVSQDQPKVTRKDPAKHQVKAVTCYRCGRALTGTWLTVSIEGKDRTVCPSKCQQ